MFEKFRKEQVEHEESSGSEMVEERPKEEPEYQNTEKEIPESQPQTESSSEGQIGIRALKDKRVKLEEAIDYVGLMIKNLKDKRTNLEKEIEDESVDIKNLKEKLMKVSEYIEEENQGIHNLSRKRSAVEHEADEVARTRHTERRAPKTPPDPLRLAPARVSHASAREVWAFRHSDRDHLRQQAR